MREPAWADLDLRTKVRHSFLTDHPQTDVSSAGRAGWEAGLPGFPRRPVGRAPPRSPGRGSPGPAPLGNRSSAPRQETPCQRPRSWSAAHRACASTASGQWRTGPCLPCQAFCGVFQASSEVSVPPHPGSFVMLTAPVPRPQSRSLGKPAACVASGRRNPRPSRTSLRSGARPCKVDRKQSFGTFYNAAMIADRIEGKWIDLFAEVFARCKVVAEEPCAVLSESQSRALNVQLAELALQKLGARRSEERRVGKGCRVGW